MDNSIKDIDQEIRVSKVRVNQFIEWYEEEPLKKLK
jgi:hypothetical protein